MEQSTPAPEARGCDQCGAILSPGGSFCSACGHPVGVGEIAAREPHSVAVAPPPRPQPVAPPPGPWPQRRATGSRSAAYLAIAGGVGMCFMVIYALVYVPLHDHFPLAFGESLQFGDLLAFGAGAISILLGVLALRRAPASPARTGAVLILAGLTCLVLVVLWAFPETFHLDYYFGRPFYFGFVYFCELGKAHIGGGYANGYVQVPLLASAAAVFAAGCLMAFARRRSPVGLA